MRTEHECKKKELCLSAKQKSFQTKKINTCKTHLKKYRISQQLFVSMIKCNHIFIRLKGFVFFIRVLFEILLNYNFSGEINVYSVCIVEFCIIIRNKCVQRLKSIFCKILSFFDNYGIFNLFTFKYVPIVFNDFSKTHS